MASGKVPFVNRPNKRGQTALYCASRQGYKDIIVELLNLVGINVNVQVQEHGGTALHGTVYLRSLCSYAQLRVLLLMKK